MTQPKGAEHGNEPKAAQDPRTTQGHRQGPEHPQQQFAIQRNKVERNVVGTQRFHALVHLGVILRSPLAAIAVGGFFLSRFRR